MSAIANGVLLDCRDLHAYYGESYVVHGVSLRVEPNQIMALLGRNGAGKTSTLRTIARGRTAGAASRRDLPEGPAAASAPDPSGGAHGHLAGARGPAHHPRPNGRGEPRRCPDRQGSRLAAQRIYEHFPRLAERRRQEGVTLSGGEQQMLAIARALARHLDLLLLDEPYEGLAPQIVREIEHILLEVKKTGITVILVEQNAIAALRIADRCAILDDGAIVFTGKPDEVLANEEIRREYLAL